MNEYKRQYEMASKKVDLFKYKFAVYWIEFTLESLAYRTQPSLHGFFFSLPDMYSKSLPRNQRRMQLTNISMKFVDLKRYSKMLHYLADQIIIWFSSTDMLVKLKKKRFYFTFANHQYLPVVEYCVHAHSMRHNGISSEGGR